MIGCLKALLIECMNLAHMRNLIISCRHRVTSCRIDDWLLEGLADVLGGPVGLLPRQPRLDVAAALLQEAALGLERALLDGGPCKW
jgi:hypothetical protein